MKPEIFHGRKKPLWRTTLISFAVAVLALGLGIANIFVDLGQGIGFVLVLVFFVFFFFGMATLPSASRPMEFRIDDAGMEMRARGNTTRILWDQLDEVRIVQAPGSSKDDWVMAWPRVAPMQLRNRMYHPEWRADQAAVRVCNLDLFQEDPETIRSAVKRSAGALWNDSATLR